MDGQDNFSWIFEGLLILIAGFIGIFGNTCSIGVFSRQRDQRVFHHLLLLLAIFDLIYIISSMMIFSFPKFSDQYSDVYLTYLLPYILPVAHVGLMGSTYSTLALGVERYLAVCHPFLSRRRLFKTRWFVIPVVIFTLIYNIPKFFELNLVFAPPMSNFTQPHNSNCSSCEPPSKSGHNFSVTIEPSEMRVNKWYIVVYIFWTNLIVNLLAPFVLLIFLNLKTYWQIKDFERTLMANKVNVSFHRRRSPQNLTTTTRAMSDEEALSSTPIQNMCTPDTADKTPTLQEELKKLFDKSTLAKAEIRGVHPKGQTYKIRVLKATKKPSSADGLEGQDVVEIAVPSHSHNCESIEPLARVNGPSHAESLRKREVALARISLYIVFVFLICHCVRLIPNTFEMIQTYLSGKGDDPEDFPWPRWVDCMSYVSHFLLTVTSSANFYIYFFKHGRAFYARCKSNSKANIAARNITIV